MNKQLAYQCLTYNIFCKRNSSAEPLYQSTPKPSDFGATYKHQIRSRIALAQSDGEDVTSDRDHVVAGRIVTRRNTSDSERGALEDSYLAKPTCPKKSKGMYIFLILLM